MSIFTKIFAGGADKLIGTIGGIVDDLTLSKEEKEKLKIDTLNAVNSHEEKMAGLAQAELDSYLKDTQSARDANVKIQESDKASWLSKNVAYMIDIFFVLVFAGMLVIIIYKAVPVDNKELFFTAFGALTMYVGQILSFHRGTTKGSGDKQKQMDTIVNKVLDNK